MNEIIKIENLEKIYDTGAIQVHALKKINLLIEQGEYVAIMGQSGSGKSTLMNILGCLDRPTGGHYYLDGIDVGKLSENKLSAVRNKKIGFVFQSFHLIPRTSAMKNVELPMIYGKIATRKRHQRAKELLCKVGLEKRLNHLPQELSGGQRQRVALGRAIVRQPKVFLLDEPLSNLDAKLRTSMRAEISKLHNKLQTTFIYVTHDQIEAMTMGTRIVVMKLGVIQQIDTPTNLFDYPENKFVAGFIGTPQMNFFDVTVKKAGSKLETTFANGQKISYSLSKLRTIDKKYLDGEEHELTLGVRGENISIKKDGLDATVTIKEVLGNTTQLFVHLTEDSRDFVVCVSERADYKNGDCVNVVFDEKTLHLFDAETEEAIMGREYGNK